MNRFALRFCLSLAITTPAAPQVAQPVPTTQAAVSDPQATAIMAVSLAAMNPNGSAPPGSVVASGTYTRFMAGSTDAYTLRVEILGLDQFRWDLTGTGPLAPATIVRNGDAGWRHSPHDTAILSVAQSAAIGAQWFPLLALSKWTSAPGMTASYVGLETVAGASLHHIAVTRAFTGTASPDFARAYQAISQCELYLSPQTNLPVRIRYYAHPNGTRSGIPLDLVFSNYTQVSGYWFPLRVSEYYGQAHTRQVDFQTISVNPPVSPSDFSKE